MRRIILAVCLVSASAFAAEKQTFESSETPATLLELFTSEGCSSCPPADAWMSRLKSSGDLWKNVVPVVFHVDYWDHLGWRDRFAKREFTARQQRYAAEWKSGSVYTPAFVANGREWRNWSDGGTVPINSSGKVGTLRVTIDESRKIAARFTPASQSNESFQLNVALLASDVESNVARGENSGRKLHHDFVVLALANATLRDADGGYFAEVTLPNEQLSDKPVALAAWVTGAEGKPPIQAVGAWLKP
ncbi:MAG: DUF1223 domain-containing protein [Verrucomicrobiota bacterium]|nr:DUF1223 domain-containing protein [Verrucomicrobiota bacterium]